MRKKRIFQINVTDSGSTGTIMKNISSLAEKKYITKMYYGRGVKTKLYQKIETYFSVFLSRFISLNNSGCYFSTINLIHKIKKYKPDLIHMHNVHGYYLNYSILFKYLKKLNIPIVWTIHDCSSYTGHCAYYSRVKCDKWKNCCSDCPQTKEYPKNLIFDSSKLEYKKKKKLFLGFNNLTLTVPSNWLNKELKKSFLKNYDTRIIHNCIDLNIFKPSYNLNLRQKYNLDNYKIILGVANVWDERKGLNYFLEISKILDDNYKIILIGLNKKQLDNLPKNILGFDKINNLNELINFYSIADVFFNPSLEETFSLVTLEALACGTPCVVFNSTATPELIRKGNGKILDCYDVNKIVNSIEEVCNCNWSKKCINTAKKYDLTNYNKYIELYDELLGD